tara:strand:+ start:3059 stop:3499 length:441 start_codon:yes stop_codon:yes gene_type:complete
MSSFDTTNNSMNTTNNSMDTTLFPNLSDLTITGVTPNGQYIILNISSNTTKESLDLSITADSLDYSVSDVGSLHLSDLNISSSGFSNNTTQETYPFVVDDISAIDLNESNDIDGPLFGGKKSRKLKKRNKNKKKRKTKKNKTKCIY